MRDRLRRVFSEAFDIPEDRLVDDSSVATLPEWDSMGQLQLMLGLELEFGVHIPADEMLELQSVAAIEEFLDQHVHE
jgi:acyl carrier protein